MEWQLRWKSSTFFLVLCLLRSFSSTATTSAKQFRLHSCQQLKRIASWACAWKFCSEWEQTRTSNYSGSCLEVHKNYLMSTTKYWKGIRREQDPMRRPGRAFLFRHSWAVLQADILWMSWCGCFSIERSFPATWLFPVCQYGTAVDQGLLKSRLFPWVARCHRVLLEWFQQIRVRHPSSAAELHGDRVLRRITNIPWYMQTLPMFAQLPSSSSVPSLSSCEVRSFNASNQFCFWKECICSAKNQDVLTYYYVSVTFEQCYGCTHS